MRKLTRWKNGSYKTRWAPSGHRKRSPREPLRAPMPSWRFGSRTRMPRTNSWRKNPEYRRNPRKYEITYVENEKTGKVDIYVHLEMAEGDTPREHAKLRRIFMEKVIGPGLLDAEKVGEVTIQQVSAIPGQKHGHSHEEEHEHEHEGHRHAHPHTHPPTETGPSSSRRRWHHYY